MTGIEEVFRAAGVTGHLHAADIDTGRELGVGSDEPVVLASVFKVALLVAFFREAAAGGLDPAEQVVLRAADRAPGPTGTAILLDDVRMSLRDLAALMITVSDNAAADVLYQRVGRGTVNATLRLLGLTRTHLAGGIRDMQDSLLAEGAVDSLGELMARLDEPGLMQRLSALDPARTTRGTPRETAALLAMIWRDEAAPPAECAQMRRMLGLQVWPHRLSSGFPYDDIVVSGKTGTMATIRNEAGVVEYPDGGRYAVAVFTRSLLPVAVLPQADAAIGTAARLAIEALRR
ncbi:serine hydrolase [Actinomadura macrotermitis]|uniref:Beta-lactamase regulatory protein BlaB n=1 Tax=Actinomadura macrotermitis TaxID=2585200 RepID=A0A7K0BS72_9ACTN|nr:serine hydrolase [Actinomadura macrotermitis]MQY04048.1 Beta-lactamase regulatory protein BlaB [Actinomadura macrotermitis]